MKKISIRSIASMAVFIFLMVLCAYLLLTRLTPKTILAVCPELERTTSCRISIVSVDAAREIEVSNEKLRELLKRLGDTYCYRDGWAEGISEGELYRLYFFDDSGVVAEISVTSLGRLRIGSLAYDLRSNELSGYLEHFMNDS